MKTILSLVACFVALCGPTTVARAQSQGGEPPLRKAETLRVSITGVPGPDQQSMLAQQIVVSNDGNVSLTYLKNEVRAANLTPTELARAIERAYKAAGIYTNPTINVSRVATPDMQLVVTVGGNVKQPGICQYRPGMKINEAIQERGGFDDFAQPKKVRLMRKGTVKELDLRNLSNHQENNVLLEPADEIIVPKSGPF